MTVIDLIDKKRKGNKLNKKELAYLVNGFVAGAILDYQMSAFLMAVTINGLSDQELLALTDILVKSGRRLDFGADLVDKHSTGGVGDKTTMIVVPLAAALGMKMVKMSGRGLGHTGGTVDKLSAIKKINLSLTEAEIKKSLAKIGACFLQQINAIAPADKLIYQLRDVTATTDSLPLIASSIMSKKIASGAKILVLDIKVGKGAFIKNKRSGLELARLMKKIADHYQINLTCVLSRMDEPLGYNIGNGLEVKECLSLLEGNYEPSLYDLSVELASHLLANHQGIMVDDAREKVTQALVNKEALSAFDNIVSNQSGDLNEVVISEKSMIIKSNVSGYIAEIDALKLGEAVRKLGAGRFKVADKISYGVGVVLFKKVGDYVTKGEPLLQVYYETVDLTVQEVLACYKFSDNKVVKPKPIIAIV